MRDVRMRNWIGLFGVASSLIISGTLVVAYPTHDVANEYTPHSAIYIFGNEEFNSANGVTSGNGTQSDPYVIEGWKIEAEMSNGITILQTSAHFVIRNVRVQSSGIIFYGISLEKLENGRVEDCEITENWKGLSIRESTNVSIVGNDIIRNEDGMLVRDSSNVTIKGNSISDNYPRNGLALTLSTGLSLTDNVISRNNWAGAVVSSSHNVTVSGNEVKSNKFEGFRVSSSTNVSFSANDISHNWDGIMLYDSSDVRISASQVVSNRAHGISSDSSSRVSIDLVYSIMNDKPGVHLESSDNINITHSTFRTNEYGISMSNSKNVTVTECILWSNPVGAFVEESSNVSFIGSDVPDNYVHGISTIDSNHLSFRQNRFYSNNGNGIYFVDTSNVSVTSNIFLENLRGVSLENSESIVIHHNEFRNHTRHARDNKGSENTWDDGYPSGGNFWDGYAGTDEFLGPNQNESGPDGIGDSPYVIDVNSQDNYPLMSPPGDLPSAPENLQASWGDSFVNLTWSPPSSDGGFPVTKYRIYRGTVSGGETFLVDTQWFSCYNDTDVTNGVRYYYRVAAINGVGEGFKSNEVASIPTAVPGPPTGLQASLGGDHWEMVMINWSPSTDDGNGQSSVVEYRVFRGLNYSFTGDGYALTAVLPNGTFEFQDVLAGEGDPNNYFYRVCAVDVNDKMNCTVNQVGKFTRNLAEGLNVVSVPLIIENMCTYEILQSVSYDEIWLYDASEKTWKDQMTLKPYDSGLCQLSRTTGLWINVTQVSNLTVAGLVPTATTVELKAGWNLVGFPFFEQNNTISDLLATMAVEPVEGFDGSVPPYFLRGLQTDESLLPGYAYWVKASADAQMTLLNS